MNEYQKIKLRFIVSLFLLGAGLLYAIWPVDLIPDLLVPVGWVDDIGILAASAVFAGLSYYKIKRNQKKIV